MRKLYPNGNGPPTATCRAIDELRLPWPYTRSIWRRNPVFRREPTPAHAARGECGTVNHCAIDILEDIIGWYRIKRIQDETTGQVVSEERLFDGDALQKDYSAWGEDLGYTKRQVQDAVAHLHDVGLIRRWCAVRTTNYGVKIGNAVFLEPCPDAIRALSRLMIAQSDDTPPPTYICERGHAQTREGSHQHGRGVPHKRETLKSLKSASKPQANSQQQEASAPPITPQEAKSVFVVEKSVSVPSEDNTCEGVAEGTITSSPKETLLAELILEGMGAAKAREAVCNRYEIAMMQLANLRHALPTEKILPSRGGWLYKAITTDYGPTKGYQQFLNIQKAEGGRRAAQAKGEAEHQAQIEAERAAYEQAESSLSAEQLADLRQRARNCVHPDFRKNGEARCVRMVQVNYQKLLRGERVSEYALWPLKNSEGRGDGEDAAAER